tara:strand:- start:1272 stop:2021 length:750 start_codon:yes stop_codon:yes gene_type:complete
MDCEDFTLKAYKSMLVSFLEKGYEFTFFNLVEDLSANTESFVLLRHDLDLSIARALPIASIEKDLGVKSTFFIRLRNGFYNPFNFEESAIIRQLLSMGHRIGLHFDISRYESNLSVNEIAKSCSKEREQLEKWFETEIKVISFHSPLPEHLDMGIKITDGVLHTYLPEYFERIFYCSDSTGKWRYGHPLDSEAFSEGKPVHLLVHPIWWTEEADSTDDILEEFLEESLFSTKSELEETLSFLKPNWSSL